MAQYGYGSGGYLTRFEDYYKSSDESEDEGDKKEVAIKNIKTETPFFDPRFDNYKSDDSDDGAQKDTFNIDPLQASINFSKYILEESEDEDGLVERERKNQNLPGDQLSGAEKDWVPQHLNDLKMTIKPPKNFKGYDEEAYQDEGEEEDSDGGSKVFSNDYADVCKYKCPLCSLDIDTEKLKTHMTSNHSGETVADSELEGRQYSKETWHRCQICNKAILFTRGKLRYHLVSEHGVSVQEYNDKHMRKIRPSRARRVSGEADGGAWDGGDADVDPSTVKEEEISNDYADIVKIVCKICNKAIEKDNFRFLHLKKHGMDLADYKLVYGEPLPVKNSYHRCYICQTIFVFTRSRLAGHLARHKVSVRDYGNKYLTKVKTQTSFMSSVSVGEIDTDCMFSNDYEDECQTVCKMCDRSLNYGNLGSHLYQTHNGRMKEYIEEFGEPEITKKSYHECAICHETLLFIRYHLVTHVKTKHNMTITAYNKAHMQLHNVEYSETNLLDKGRKIGTQKAPQWCDGTMYKCPYCFNIYYRYFTFRIHLINSHKMTDTEERSICVKENEILTDIYRCKICATQVKRDRMDIEAHLKQAHKTTLKIYSANFENINVKESAKEMVEKLVRMGVLEEPCKSRCITPKKIKIKSTETPKKTKGKPNDQEPMKMNLNTSDQKSNQVPENDTKFVTISENVAATGDEENISNQMQPEQRVKTELYDATYLSLSSYSQPHLALDTETENLTQPDSKRKRKLSSKLSSDFEISQVESLTPKRSKDVTSKKPSKIKKKASSSSTSSPLTQRSSNTPNQKESDDQPVQMKVETGPTGPGEDEGWIYKCPLYPCEWTCGRDGMRKGPAVLHLLKIHKIQPLEMRAKGIKFDKIKI